MDRWITTTEAAQRLGVKRATLYAYVSRGLLVSRRMPGQAESMFDRTQIDSLAAAKHDGRREADRLLRFRAVATRVSALRADQLFLRGQPIGDICASFDFATASRFVLQADDAAPPPKTDLAAARGVDLERRIPLAVALIAAHDPLRADRSAIAERTLGLLPVLAATVPEVELQHPWVDALATCLIDNGLAASTTAARVAASARAGLYDSLLAGYGAMAGALHGGAPVAAHRLLGRVLGGEQIGRVLADSSARGNLPGFGHVVYRSEDPRASVLLEMVRRDRPDTPALLAAEAVAQQAQRPINVDLVGAVIAHAIELPARAVEVLFQYGRTVGMAAHVIEEYAEAPLRWRGSNSTDGR